MAAQMRFWDWLVGSGGQGAGFIQGDPNYYSGGQANPEEFRHALNTAWGAAANNPNVATRYQFWKMLVDMGAIQGDHNYYASGQASQAEIDHAIAVAANFLDANPNAASMEFSFTDTTVDPVGGGTGANAVGAGAPAEEGAARTGVGGAGSDPDTRLYILSGKKMKWYFDPQSGKWYVGYGLPNSDREMIFEADPDQLDALFGDGMRPINYTRTSLSTLTSTGRRTFSGNISEMEGKGTFEAEYQRIIALAVDSGRLPDWAANDQEVEELLFIAQAENKSDEWLITQITNTAGFRSRFGGSVEALKSAANLSTIDAISGVLELEANLIALEKSYGRSGDRITAAMMTDLINKGVSMSEIQKSYEVFKRMEDSREALDAFNQVLVANGQQPLGVDDMYNFLSGQAPQDIYDLYEASSIREAAVKYGLGDLFSASDAIQAALETYGVLDMVDIERGLQDAASLLLRLRHEVSVNEYGLDAEDLIDISMGLMPRSGKKREDILEGINKATSSAQAYLQNRAVSPYRQYQGGRVQQASLAGARTSG